MPSSSSPTSTSTSTTSTARPLVTTPRTGLAPSYSSLGSEIPNAINTEVPAQNSSSRIPVTPAVLRSIFASSRTAHEERSMSRVAFFRFAGFMLSCIGISLAAARNFRGGKTLGML